MEESPRPPPFSRSQMLDLVESGSQPLCLATFSEDSKQRGNPPLSSALQELTMGRRNSRDYCPNGLMRAVRGNETRDEGLWSLRCGTTVGTRYFGVHMGHGLTKQIARDAIAAIKCGNSTSALYLSYQQNALFRVFVVDGCWKLKPRGGETEEETEETWGMTPTS
jgi:hypothetical protein